MICVYAFMIYDSIVAVIADIIHSHIHLFSFWLQVCSMNSAFSVRRSLGPFASNL